GVGLSTGFADTNTIQQGRDILAMIASLRSGSGLRILPPQGKELRGREAVSTLRAGAPVALPVLLFGNSRGTMASGWAMTMNFDKNCSYDMPKIRCEKPVADRSIRGALLLAE